MDYYSDRLTAGGGEEGSCGWLKDRFGDSWQVVPAELIEMLTNPDKEKVKRATESLFKMKKLDIRQLKQAFNS